MQHFFSLHFNFVILKNWKIHEIDLLRKFHVIRYRMFLFFLLPAITVMTDMNNHYFQLDETEGCLVSPTVGQTCVALYEEMWYRAKVLSISVNDMTVHYVDYGNDETLQPSVVKQITPSFLKTPEVAIECSLDLNRDEWPEESTALFEELTGDEEKKFIIKIVGNQGDRYEVKLFDTDANCLSTQVLSTIPGTGMVFKPLISYSDQHRISCK